MSDTNVHRVVGNLLVGTSHFFVDTTTNRVGVNTSSPSASLDIASGDLKVGSGITIGNNGTITATAFDGDGSLLQNINSDSGSWVNGTNSNVHLATSTDKVGIGATASIDAKLHIGPIDDNHLYLASSNNAYGWILDTDDQGNGAVPFRIKKRLNGTDTTVLTIKNQDGFVGIGTNHTATRELDVAGDINLNGTGRTIYFDATGGSGLYWSYGTSRILDDGDLRICTDDNMHFNTGCSSTTVGTERMVIKSDGDVGIGTDPNEKLHVNGNIAVSWSSTRRMIMNYDNTYRQGFHFDAGTRTMKLFSTTADSGGDIAFYTRKGAGSSDTDYGTEKMRIRANGNIDFKPVSSGSYSLMNFWSNVNYGSDRGFILVQDESANSPGSGSEDLRMTVGVYNDFNQSSSHSDQLWLQGGGRLCFNVGSWDSELNSIIGTPGSGTSHGGLKYEWRVGNSKRMQLNSSGQLTLGPGGSSSYAHFRNDGTWWRNYSSTNGAGIHLTGGAVMPADYNGNWPYSPTLGTSTYRWGQIYSTHSSISTSDRTTKQDINEITESEKKVAVKMVNLFRTYRVKNAVEEKGENARVHSGVVAQDLIEAFQSEGLDAHRYGLFCYDDVWMVDGKDELFETVYTKNGDRNFVDENGVWREYTADDEGVEEVKEGTGIFADKDTPGAVATPGLYSIRYEELLCFVVGGVLKDLQTTDADLKKELQSEKEKVATMELLVASLVKRIGDLENLVI